MTVPFEMWDGLRAVARRHLGPDDGDLLVGLARPAVALGHAETGARTHSRLGGLAVLEPAQEWPSWGPKPLNLVAVLDLAELSPFELDVRLPPAGLLNLFYDAEDQRAWGFDPGHRDGWRVVLADPARGVTVAPPDGVTVFDEVAVRAVQTLTVPDPGEEVLEGVELRHGEALYDAVEEWREHHGDAAPRHQVGGWPVLVQNPIQLECELASNGVSLDDNDEATVEALRPGASHWRLLAQIDSDEDAGWMWGDVGTIYYAIREDDATAGRFDRAWTILQCC